MANLGLDAGKFYFRLCLEDWKANKKLPDWAERSQRTVLQGSFSTTFLFSITKFKPATPNLTRLAPLHHDLVFDTHLEIFYQEIYLQSFSLTKSVWRDWDWGEGGRLTSEFIIIMTHSCGHYRKCTLICTKANIFRQKTGTISVRAKLGLWPVSFQAVVCNFKLVFGP